MAILAASVNVVKGPVTIGEKIPNHDNHDPNELGDHRAEFVFIEHLRLVTHNEHLNELSRKQAKKT